MFGLHSHVKPSLVALTVFDCFTNNSMMLFLLVIKTNLKPVTRYRWDSQVKKWALVTGQNDRTHSYLTLGIVNSGYLK